MAGHSSALLSLCECLRGSFPARADWLSLIGLANQTLTTPTLIGFVSQFEQDLPKDVCAYVRHIHRRNLSRNERLTAQLEEAIVAINGRGVTPVLLKGAATLATAPKAGRDVRLMSDLDIMVGPDQIEAAFDALSGIGYELHFQTPSDSEKWFAELKRPQDVGMIDLHQRPPGPAFFYRSQGDVLQHSKRVSIGEGSAYIPTATYQALMLIIHDQFQDYGYWVGEIDIRHLIELRDLCHSPEGIDWDQLAGFATSSLARNAVESQLIALARLLGVNVPLRMCGRFIPRLQFARQLIQARFPMMRWPLLIVPTLDYRNYRRGPGLKYQASRGLPGFLPKGSSLRFILRIAKGHRVGKV